LGNQELRNYSEAGHENGNRFCSGL